MNGRNISFFHTQKPFKDKTKDVTRRQGWLDLIAGDVLCGVVKGRGIPKGGHVEKMGKIEILNVRREPLNAITPEDVIREGFPDMTPAEFVTMFCRNMKCDADEVITRIEYKYV